MFNLDFISAKRNFSLHNMEILFGYLDCIISTRSLMHHLGNIIFCSRILIPLRSSHILSSINTGLPKQLDGASRIQANEAVSIPNLQFINWIESVMLVMVFSAFTLLKLLILFIRLNFVLQNIYSNRIKRKPTIDYLFYKRIIKYFSSYSNCSVYISI